MYLEAISYELPPVVVTSEEIEERLEPLYEKLNVRTGTLRMLTGISERRWWKPRHSLSQNAAAAESDQARLWSDGSGRRRKLDQVRAWAPGGGVRGPRVRDYCARAPRAPDSADRAPDGSRSGVRPRLCSGGRTRCPGPRDRPVELIRVRGVERFARVEAGLNPPPRCALLPFDRPPPRWRCHVAQPSRSP